MTTVEVLKFLRGMSEVIAEHVAPWNEIRIQQLVQRIRSNGARPKRIKRIGSGKGFHVFMKVITTRSQIDCRV